ncbi:hypothetical protein [Prosthecobacter fluviatilis]|uniref:Uncharacterized protein n=1 Tax=Prosthecobacter fluviatilis TaxID=445931 RepID=A0ABW0KRI4_9BACT
MAPSLIVCLTLILPTLLTSCQSEKPAPVVAPVGKSIGSAHLTKDGILEVMLRAEGEGGMVGDAFFAYKKDTPEYEKMMKHIGGLKCGESKLVPAYP